MRPVLEHILFQKLNSAVAIALLHDNNIHSSAQKTAENFALYKELIHKCIKTAKDYYKDEKLQDDKSYFKATDNYCIAVGKINNEKYVSILWDKNYNDDETAQMKDYEWLSANWRRLRSLLASCQIQSTQYPTPYAVSHGKEDDIAWDITRLFEASLLKRNVKLKSDHCWDNDGIHRFHKQIKEKVTKNTPILFVLPAFPDKSCNTRTKVFGTLPDMAEQLGLKRLHEFLENVGKIYNPGARLLIFTDGRVYCDLVRNPDHVVTEFKKSVRRLLNPPSPYIQWTDLDEIFADLSPGNADKKRAALVGIFGSDYESVLDRIKKDVDFCEVYNGFKLFNREELSFPEEWSKRRVDRECGQVAKLMLQRTDALQTMIKCLFPDHIRLSIHPSSSVAKFSIDLVGKTDWGTPWHNCALLQPDGSWSLIRKATAENMNFQLQHSEDGLPYFLNNSGVVFKEKL